MATNLAIDTQLLDAAVRAGGLNTKRETVNQALREFVEKRETAGIINLFGKIDYDKDYDYKKSRRFRSCVAFLFWRVAYFVRFHLLPV